MSYSPKSQPTISTLDELRGWTEDELGMISQEFEGSQLINGLQPSYRDVAKPRDGMLIYADGVSFNPGEGRGTYERVSGAWRKLAHLVSADALTDANIAGRQFYVGDIIWKRTPVGGGSMGWMCVTAGIAGSGAVFKAMPNLAA